MVINFDTKPTVCNVVNFDDCMNDSKLFQYLDLMSFDNRMYSFNPFWGWVLAADEIQKAKPSQLQIPDFEIRNKIITGSSAKIGVLDPTSKTCKFIWVTLLSRSPSSEGPIYSAFFNHDDNDLGITRFSFIPYLRPSYIFDTEMHDLLPVGETAFDENFQKLTTYEQKRFIEIFMEYKNIPMSIRTQIKQKYY